MFFSDECGSQVHRATNCQIKHMMNIHVFILILWQILINTIYMKSAYSTCLRDQSHHWLGDILGIPHLSTNWNYRKYRGRAQDLQSGKIRWRLSEQPWILLNSKFEIISSPRLKPFSDRAGFNQRFCVIVLRIWYETVKNRQHCSSLSYKLASSFKWKYKIPL